MTELDQELAPVVLETIEEFGKSVTLITVAQAGDYDPDTASAERADDDPKLIKGIIEDANAKGLVEGASEKLFIAAASVNSKPSVGDKVSRDGFTLNVFEVETIYSGELACLYILHLGLGPIGGVA